MLGARADLDLPRGDGFVWAAAEAGVARAVRGHAGSLGHLAAWIKASGYWKKGVADTHEKVEG